MEINRFEDVIGGVTQADIVEGRFVVMTTNTFGGGFMNTDDDLPGFAVPSTAEEAKRAKFCLTWAVDNRQAPLVNYPGTTFDFRGGWVNSESGPLTGLTMWLSHPGNQEGQTIPSGYKALGYTEGTFTLPSGHFVDSSDIKVPGCAIMIEHSGADAGKPKAQTSLAVGFIGFTEAFDADKYRLTIRVE